MLYSNAQQAELDWSQVRETIKNAYRRYNPVEWSNLQQQICSRFSMQSEKLVYDAFLDVKTVERALQISN